MAAPDASPNAASLSDADALAFFDERVHWQVAQFHGALEGVEVRRVPLLPLHLRRKA